MSNNQKRTQRILLAGGGTGGSVTPLLAIAESTVDYEFLFIGTNNGPEVEMVKRAGIEFKTIASGKLRRYFDWQNFIDPFKIFFGFVQSIFVILKWKPELVISAGAFVSVPVVWAAWILRVPVIIHQQDVRPGLANKLMATFARVITVTFERSLKDYGKKAVWIGNPVRQSITNYELQNTNNFRFENDLPIVLVVGGGTGAEFLNGLITNSDQELSQFCNVILVTGKNKLPAKNYQLEATKCFEFLNVDEMAEALYLAHVVVSRCGMSFLTELSYLGKPSILIPLPGTHQEDNARAFEEKAAAIVLDQKKTTSRDFVNSVRDLTKDEDLQNRLSQNISAVIKKGANAEFGRLINNTLK